ncbi:hypothetical protein GCM10008967_07040 [Bacillus carboniphilus]|uniref:DnaB/C C-terminal domain-containing protein n=1 Tax=Bacillus carboniphilus TaxID=86663 RepID=A0ABN0VWK5_9BACI
MNNLLINESPILVLPSLASKVGLNEAIVLQQIHYWLQKSTHEYEGKPWVYNTYDAWTENFPFWSRSTVVRIIKKLEKLGLLISRNFNQRSADNTKWYTINFELLELEEEETEMSSPIPPTQHEQTPTQNDHPTYSIRLDDVPKMSKPLPESTSEITLKIKKEDDDESAQTPFQFFEQNGIGTLGGYMVEKIQAWCLDLSDELVLEAMKIAAEYGAKSWRYVEAILVNWVDKGISTVDEAKALQLKFKEKIRSRRNGVTRKREPIPEWFVEEKKRRQESYGKVVEEDFDFERERRLLEIELGRNME